LPPLLFEPATIYCGSPYHVKHPDKHASIERLSAYDLAGEVLRFARGENVTQIVLGRSRRSFIARVLRRSFTEEIVRWSHDIAIHVVMDETARLPTAPRTFERAARFPMAAGLGAAIAGSLPQLGLGLRSTARCICQICR
jgi:hypothetical protein